eukprot:TRINITY_DN108386_c0_g1_i1.p1 TRINITY_DN108386_c0_g1~~TRINITY_DN108386_c0_g1_i1.p1  ORF type:complete len:106 (+),score=2.67 TRINITY_DN108386_c0_g1_i1:143-460(+)
MLRSDIQNLQPVESLVDKSPFQKASLFRPCTEQMILASAELQLSHKITKKEAVAQTSQIGKLLPILATHTYHSQRPSCNFSMGQNLFSMSLLSVNHNMGQIANSQ